VSVFVARINNNYITIFLLNFQYTLNQTGLTVLSDANDLTKQSAIFVIIVLFVEIDLGYAVEHSIFYFLIHTYFKITLTNLLEFCNSDVENYTE